MATVTRTYLVDDLNGSDVDVQTVAFSLDGTDYEIDLDPANADRLRDALARFLENATQSRSRPAKKSQTRSRRSQPVVSGPDQTRAVRTWASANGYQVSARGRIPTNVLDAFNAAH